MKLLWMVWAFLAGAVLPLQVGLNGRMGAELKQPLVASMLSFAVGMVTMLLFTIGVRSQINWSGLQTAPPWVWLAGVVGAFYVTSVILLAPKLGGALTFSLVVLGQMCLSLLIDHFGLLGIPQHSASIWRLLGLALIVGGVVLFRLK